MPSVPKRFQRARASEPSEPREENRPRVSRGTHQDGRRQHQDQSGQHDARRGRGPSAGVTIAAEVHPAGVTIEAEVHPQGVTVAAEVHPAVVTIAAEVHPAVVTIAAEVHPTGVIIAAEVHLLAVVLAHAHRVIFVGQMNVSADPERTLLEREENPEDDPRTEESIDTKRLPVHLDQSDALKPFSHRRNSTEQTAQHPSFVLILWNKSPFVESVQCAVHCVVVPTG